ncbi:hypothetical protein RCL1_002143 [Eukaryota sp. TZLM3-RCL]
MGDRKMKRRLGGSSQKTKKLRLQESEPKQPPPRKPLASSYIASSSNGLTFAFYNNHEIISGSSTISPLFSNEITILSPSITPSKSSFNQVQSLVGRIKRLIGTVLRADFSLVPFGSFASSVLWTSKSDLDLSLFLKSPSSFSKTHPSHALTLLKSVSSPLKSAFPDLQIIASKNVPILKFTCAKSLINIDLSVNSSQGVLASCFLKSLFSICPIGADLAKVIKMWSKSRNLNDPSNGGLSSYALVLLVISFLQNFHPKFLPFINEILDEDIDSIDGLSSLLFSSVRSGEFENKCKKFPRVQVGYTLPELVALFFIYIFQLNLQKKAISILSDQCPNRQRYLKRLNSSQTYRPYVIIIDPLDASNNAARALSGMGKQLFTSEVERCIAIINGKSDQSLFNQSTRFLQRSSYFGSIFDAAEFEQQEDDVFTDTDEDEKVDQDIQLNFQT